MNKRLVRIGAVLAVAIAVMAGIILFNGSQATALDEKTIVKKFYATNYYDCVTTPSQYNGQKGKGRLNRSVDVQGTGKVVDSVFSRGTTQDMLMPSFDFGGLKSTTSCTATLGSILGSPFADQKWNKSPENVDKIMQNYLKFKPIQSTTAVEGKFSFVAYRQERTDYNVCLRVDAGPISDIVGAISGGSVDLAYENCWLSDLFPSESKRDESSLTITATRDDSTGHLKYKRNGNWFENQSNELQVSLTKGGKAPNGKLKFEVDDTLWSEIGSGVASWLSGIPGGCTVSNDKVYQYDLTDDINDLYASINSGPNSLFLTTIQLNCKQPYGANGITPLPINQGVIKKSTITYTFGVDSNGGVRDVVSHSETSSYSYPDTDHYSSETAATKAAIETMTGLSKDFGWKLTPTERYQLYDYYIDEAIKTANNGVDNIAYRKTCYDPGEEAKQRLTPVTLYDSNNGEFSQCWINLGGTSPDSIYVNDQNLTGTAIESKSLTKIIEWLGNPENTKDIDVSQINGVVSSTNPFGASSSSQDVEALCLSADDASSASWILCPAMSGMAEGSDGIYGWVKGMLKVDAGMVSSDNVAYEIWGRFRDIANIFFIILLLIVILSQVTGYGIDNYGIKKMLPRLIISAILINLSYIVCQAAVDLSNIVGNSLGLLLSSIARSTGNETGFGFGSLLIGTFGGAAAGTAAGLPFAVTIATIAGTAAGWWIIVIVAIIVLLIAAVAILVVFLMLGARQLIVVVAVAIAPLAIICYALPNTEKLFKRWLDIFKAALFMFPICSALSGIGQIIQAIVAGSSENLGFAVAMLAAACPFLPFLVLPTLLKNSLKAVGDLGNKLSGLRNKAMNAGRSINSALRNTDTYKDAQFQTAMRRNQTKLDKLMAKAKGGELSQSQQMRLNRYQRRAAAFEKEDAERKIYAKGGFEAARAAIESSTSKQEVENAATLWGRDHNGYNSDEMYGELSRIMNLEDGQTLTAQDELTMKALMMKMSNGSGYDKKLMAKAISKGSNAGSVAAAAKYMTKNGDVASAISKKDAATAQYLRELNGNGINTRAADGSVVSFSDWYKAERRDADGNLTGATNARFVMSEVSTENADFVGQSASVVARSLGLKEIRDENGETQYVHDAAAVPELTMGSDRIGDIVKDELLMNSADINVRKALMAAAQYHGIDVPASSNTAPVPITNPAPAPSNAAPVDETQLDIEHSTPKINVEQVVEQMNNGSRERMQTKGGIILNESPEVQRQLEQEFMQRKDGTGTGVTPIADQVREAMRDQLRGNKPHQK